MSERAEKRKISVDDRALQEAGINNDEITILATFHQTPAFSALMKFLKYSRRQSELKLRSPEASIEQLRYHQGCVGALNELADLIAEDLPEWYNNGTRSKGGR